MNGFATNQGTPKCLARARAAPTTKSLEGMSLGVLAVVRAKLYMVQGGESHIASGRTPPDACSNMSGVKSNMLQQIVGEKRGSKSTDVTVKPLASKTLEIYFEHQNSSKMYGFF